MIIIMTIVTKNNTTFKFKIKHKKVILKNMKNHTIKSLGQVFIKDKNIIDKIIQHAEITPETHVVEIGCGEGWLSQALAKHAKSLTIIEIDPRFFQESQERLQEFSNISFVLGDILKVGFTNVLPKNFHIIANVPYYISAKIIQLIAENHNRISYALLMLQKEFVQKLVALPNTKNYTSLTVYTQFHFETKNEFLISKNSFRPVPKIDSAMLSLKPKKLPKDIDPILFSDLIQTAFWGRRKPLLSCLKKSPFCTLDSGFETLPFFQENPTIRGEALSLEKFEELYRALIPYRIKSTRKIRS
jgi:16S rRNA (adenine1518-N6/adenine1519-N6)-dimethyltransferase